MKKLFIFAAALALTAANALAQKADDNEKDNLYIAEYDFEQKDYKKCLEQVVAYTAAEYVTCLNAEIARQDAALRGYYEALLKFPEFQKWNGSNNLFRGNLKDMDDQFIAYRERLCSLSGLALYQFYGDLEHGRKECIKDVNDELLRRLERMYNSSQADFGPDVYHGESY